MAKRLNSTTDSVPTKISRLTKRVSEGWLCEVDESCGHVQLGNALNAYNFARHIKNKHPSAYNEHGLGTVVQERNSESRSEPSIRINMSKKTFLAGVVKLVTKHKLPYNALMWDGMKQIMCPIENALKIKVNSSNGPLLVKQTADGIQQLITAEVKNKMVSIQFDTTTKYGRCIIGVAVLFVKDSTPVKRTLGN